MHTVTKYLLIEVTDNNTWKIRNKHPFDNEDDAWDWVDRRYKKDEDRLRFYLFPIELKA
jgi:hypothetical protein